jgi:putative membrane protein
LSKETTESFLGSQGDIWDAQWDMTFALIGAICALLFVSRLHNLIMRKAGIKVDY